MADRWSRAHSWEVITATVEGEDVTGPVGPFTKKSHEVDLYGYSLVGLIIPTITSSNLTFEVCHESGGTFVVLKDKAGNAITITAGTGGFAVSSVDLEPLKAYRWMKVVCSASQATSRDFLLLVKS